MPTRGLLFASCAFGVMFPSAQVSAQSADLSQVMIDVSSNNQLPALLSHTAERQIELIVVRATIGLGSPDKAYDRNVAAIRSSQQKLSFGAYHALYPTHSGNEQAVDFLETVRKSCRPGERVLLAVDWEQPVLNKKTLDEAPTAVLEDFISTIRAWTNVSPLVYTGPDIISKHRSDIGPLATSSPLWLSTYYSRLYLNRQCAGIKGVQNGFTCTNSIHGLLFPDDQDYAPWMDWTFWQFSAASHDDPQYLRRKVTKALPVDVSFFGGSRADFRSFYETQSVKCEDIRAQPEIRLSDFSRL